MQKTMRQQCESKEIIQKTMRKLYDSKIYRKKYAKAKRMQINT